MLGRRFNPPAARAVVTDPLLVRPDWTAGVPRDPDSLWLDKNENTDPQLAAITARVFAETAASAIYAYPEIAPLYRKLGSTLSLDADHLLLTHGSDGAIRAVFETYISPGDIVVHTAPTFAMYLVYARMYGAKTVALSYESSADGPVLRSETLVKTITTARPKLVCLPNPDSPTGTVFEHAALRRIIETAGEAGALILIDEAYYPFYGETVLAWIAEYPHLVVARTFAKAWGLAGLRIGYAAACPEVVRLLHRVRPMYEVNTVAVAMVERMLDLSGDVLASVKRLNEGRDAFLAAMRGLGLRTLESKGNFLHVAFDPHAHAVHAALKGRVLYRQDFQEPCLAGFSRFTATTVQRAQPVIELIRQVVLESPNARRA